MMMKKTMVSALLALALIAAPPTAFAQELVVGGQIVGIQLNTEGVMVAGLGEVETAAGSRAPARDAGVQTGDRILAVDGRPVKSAGELIDAVTALNGAAAELTVRRADRELRLTVQPARSAQEQWLLGMWLRDGISGIGTLTYWDPATGTYGALGHSVSDELTGEALPMSEGSITDAEVMSVQSGNPGTPGELNGCADTEWVLGSVERNTEHGIFGALMGCPGGTVLETGALRIGPATILSTVSGRQVRQYAVQITRIYKDSDGTHVLLSVTDPQLRALTGGIVQGMSGSPILQDGRLVAAVTHVFVSDPTRGYGISIYDMLAAAGILDEQAA